MAIDATLMKREVDLVVAEGQANTHYRIECQIQAAGVWYNPFRLDLYSISRNYEVAWSEELVISFLIGLGTYTYRLIPNRTNLLVELRFIPLGEGSIKQRSDKRTQVLRYRGFIINQDNQALVGKQSQATNEDSLNRVAPISVEMQLLTETAYRVNMSSTGRCYRDMNPMDAVVALFTESVSSIGGNDSQRILGVDVVPGYNLEKRKTVVIPHGTRLNQVPLLVQEKEGGLYPTGVGRFLQDQRWWVYPLYDTERVNKKLRRLVVYNIPSNRMDGAERTYRLTDTQLIVLATGDASALDPSLFEQMNTGNGLRFTDARKLMTSFGVTKENRLLFDRASNLFEVAGNQLATEANNVQWAGPATGNPFKHYSTLAKNKGQTVAMTWRYGDTDLLVPGMPVEFHTVAEDKVVSYRGVLLAAHEQRVPAESGSVVQRHSSSVDMKLFINTDDPVI